MVKYAANSSVMPVFRWNFSLYTAHTGVLCSISDAYSMVYNASWFYINRCIASCLASVTPHHQAAANSVELITRSSSASRAHLTDFRPSSTGQAAHRRSEVRAESACRKTFIISRNRSNTSRSTHEVDCGTCDNCWSRTNFCRLIASEVWNCLPSELTVGKDDEPSNDNVVDAADGVRAMASAGARCTNISTCSLLWSRLFGQQKDTRSMWNATRSVCPQSFIHSQGFLYTINVSNTHRHTDIYIHTYITSFGWEFKRDNPLAHIINIYLAYQTLFFFSSRAITNQYTAYIYIASLYRYEIWIFKSTNSFIYDYTYIWFLTPIKYSFSFFFVHLFCVTMKAVWENGQKIFSNSVAGDRWI